VLAQIIKWCSGTGSKAPVQKLANKIAGIFILRYFSFCKKKKAHFSQTIHTEIRLSIKAIDEHIRILLKVLSPCLMQ